MAEARLRQDILFPAGASLGISVDEALKVRRVNDPDSRAIKAARYGVVHWTVVEVDGAAVSTKSDLVKALQAKTSGDVRVTFESPENRAPQASPLALKRTLDAIGGDEPGEAAGRAFLKRLKAQHRRPPPTKLEGAQPRPRDDDQEARIVAGSCTWRLNKEDPDKADDLARRACAAHAVVGSRAFDCGDIYAGVEELVGRFLATARGQHRALADAVRLHTKVVPDRHITRRCVSPDPLARRRGERAVARCVEASVWRSANRLGAAVIDLVYLHWGDWSEQGFDAALKTLEALRVRGVVRDVGLTNVDAQSLQHLLEAPSTGTPRIHSVQVNLSVVDRRALTSGLAELCVAHDVRLLAHGALMGGLLSKKWLGASKPSPDAHPNIRSNLVLVEEFGGWQRFQNVLQALHDVACHRDGVTLSMVAVAWALAQTGVKAVVLGARAAEHVKDAGRAERLELTEAELETIDAACADAPGPSGDVYALERTTPVLSHMNQQGRSDAVTTDHLRECSRRLAELHALYAKQLPPAPEGLFEQTVKKARNWTAPSAYANLEVEELVLVLRGFVAEVDCLPSENDEDLLGAPAPAVSRLRTFAARMLAATEQALFVSRNKGTTKRIGSYEDINKDAATQAQGAFRARVLAACLDGESPTPNADGCCVS